MAEPNGEEVAEDPEASEEDGEATDSEGSGVRTSEDPEASDPEASAGEDGKETLEATVEEEVAENAAASEDDERTPPPRASKPKKKKKKTTKREPLDAAGRERPRFLLDFPKDPELEKLIAAFESGDYATTLTGARALADKSKKRRVREAAMELVHRTQPDPLMKYLLLASVVLLVFLTLHSYFSRGH